MGITWPILKIKDLKKSFGDNHVLNGFSMNLYDAENLVLMGKSGSGKSVMIKCVVGLMQADAGIIEIMEKDIKLNNENLCWVPFFKKADLIAITKSSLLVSIIFSIQIA